MVYCKRIIPFLIIFLYICSSCYAVEVVNPTEQTGDYTTIYDDSYFNLYLWEYNWQDELITRLWYAKGDSNYEPAARRIFEQSLELGNSGKSILVLRDNESQAFTVYAVNLDAFSYSGGSIVTGSVNMNGIIFPNQKIYSGYFGKIAAINSTGGVAYTPSVGVSNYIAAPMLGIFNPRWVDLFTHYGYLSTDDPSFPDYSSELSSILSAQNRTILELISQSRFINEGFDNVTNTIDSSTNSVTNELENIQDKIEDTNEFLESTDVDDSNYNLPTIDVSDPTSSGIDNIFTKFYNAIIREPPAHAIFPVPFTNKSIHIDGYYTVGVLSSNGAQWVIDFARAFYWYLISRYIIKDISKIIKKIKSGNVDNLENENIKEEML